MKRRPLRYGLLLFSLLGLIFFVSTYVLTKFAQSGRGLGFYQKVAVLYLEEVIVDSRDLVADLDRLRRDRSVAAIVLRIDSPGGGVAASQEIYQAVLRAGEEKTLVASLGAVAASGGYLIACGADKILANPGTITGSISAVMHFPHFDELLKKIGISSTVIKSGKFKDLGSPFRTMTKEEQALLQGLVDDIWDQFLTVVAQRRQMAREDLLKIADGRIFSGQYALEAGLVDQLGDQNDAIELAARLAGIVGEPKVVHIPQKRDTWWQLLLDGGRLSRAVTRLLQPGARYQYY